MVVHFAGQPARMDELQALAGARGLFLLADAAHATGARYRGRPVGSIGDATAFSFYATKNLTTGEGGMLTTNRPDVEETVRLYSLHGMSRDAWRRYGRGEQWFYQVVAPGFKYNLSDIQAALGLAQLERIGGAQRAPGGARGPVERGARGVRGGRGCGVRPEIEHAWHLYVIRIRPEMLTIERNRFIEELHRRGIGTSVHFIPVHRHAYYRETYGCRDEHFPWRRTPSLARFRCHSIRA
jgi:dTDP-4-amino-4,6-dideoxygalactose transaminase